MPLGTTAVSAKNLPTEPYIITAAQWQATAKKNNDTVFTSVGQPMGENLPFTLPQVGIAAELLVSLDAKMVVGTPSATPNARWPYGLLNTFNLGINGQQNIFDVIGEDLRVRADIAFPAYSEQVDTFPGTLGTPTAIVKGTYRVHLSWRVPIAVELVTLAGALYLQSPSVTCRAILGTATPAAVFGTNHTKVTFSTATWTVQEIFFVPAYSTKGEIICPPGIQTLHAMTSIDLPITSVGQNAFSLVRGSGNLQRLFMSFRQVPASGAIVPFSAAPTAATAVKINEIVLSYAQKQQPLVYTPAAALLRDNNRDYGEVPPYDYLVIDTLKWTPARDAIYYPGLTELKLLAWFNSPGTGGTAHLVQEDIFS